LPPSPRRTEAAIQVAELVGKGPENLYARRFRVIYDRRAWQPLAGNNRPVAGLSLLFLPLKAEIKLKRLDPGHFLPWHTPCSICLARNHTMKTAEMIEPEIQTISGENVIQIPDGLLGFEQVKKYVLLAQPQEAPFMWLRMIENANKRFIVVSPFQILPDYQPDISSEDVKFLGLSSPDDALVVNIVTLRPNRVATINLKGPIVINRHTLIAKQVIPNNASKFDVNHPLPVS
jgi:flagellar assembly factor FliW